MAKRKRQQPVAQCRTCGLSTADWQVHRGVRQCRDCIVGRDEIPIAIALRRDGLIFPSTVDFNVTAMESALGERLQRVAPARTTLGLSRLRREYVRLRRDVIDGLLAKRGLSRGTVSLSLGYSDRWLSGCIAAWRVYLATGRKIADALGVSLEEIAIRDCDLKETEG